LHNVHRGGHLKRAKEVAITYFLVPANDQKINRTIAEWIKFHSIRNIFQDKEQGCYKMQ